MALFATLGEVGGNMVRARRPLVILQVAGSARCTGQVVVIVLMALSALTRRYGVGTGEGEACGRVIETRARP